MPASVPEEPLLEIGDPAVVVAFSALLYDQRAFPLLPVPDTLISGVPGKLPPLSAANTRTSSDASAPSLLQPEAAVLEICTTTFMEVKSVVATLPSTSVLVLLFVCHDADPVRIRWPEGVSPNHPPPSSVEMLAPPEEISHSGAGVEVSNPCCAMVTCP